MCVLFLIACLKQAGEDVQLPIFCLEWTHPQSKLPCESSGTLVLSQRAGSVVPALGSPSSVVCTWSCCNFASGFSSNKGLRLHVFHNFFSCKTSYPCASVVVFSTAAVRQVWSTQMDKGVCTTTEGVQRAAAL